MANRNWRTFSDDRLLSGNDLASNDDNPTKVYRHIRRNKAMAEHWFNDTVKIIAVKGTNYLLETRKIQTKAALAQAQTKGEEKHI